MREGWYAALKGCVATSRGRGTRRYSYGHADASEMVAVRFV